MVVKHVFWRVLLAGSLVLGTASCGKSDDKKDEDAEESGDSDGDGKDDGSETAIEASAGTVMNVGVLALSSLGTESMGLEASSSLRLLEEDPDDDSDSEEEEETVSDRDEHCSDNGNAMNADGERMSETEENYASTVMYCAAVFNAGSPDSVLGAMSVAGVLACELERAGAWSSDDDFTLEGNEVGDVTIELSTECAEQWLIDRLSEGDSTEFPLSDVVLTKLPDSHGYDKKISMAMGEDEPSVFYIRNSNGFIAAKTDNWAFSIDKKANVLRYETLGESEDNDTEEKYVRRIRLKIDGELSSTGAFSSISDVQGLKLEGRGVDEDWAELVTIAGSPDEGLVTNLYYQNGATDGEMVSKEDQCSSDDCSAVTAISATESKIEAFHKSAKDDFEAHEAKEGILVFDSVDLSGNVSYDAKR